jgi:hypothetical protein
MHVEALTRHLRSQKQDDGRGATTIKRPAHLTANQRRAAVRKPRRRRAVAVPLGGETLL